MAVILKGTRDGLLITLGVGEWSSVLSELATQLARPRAAEFFHGAHARLALGDRSLNGEELSELGRLLAEHEMQLDLTPHDAPVRSRPVEEKPVADAPEHKSNNGRLAAPDDKHKAQDDRHDHDLWTEAAIVRRTVRSGQVIRYSGHVAVYGDVNAGGEIIAGGDVIIWGKLRGVVHAGASGDESAIVAALFLAPTQLRIGSYIARAPDDRNKGLKSPEVARVRDGRIVIETWKAKD